MDTRKRIVTTTLWALLVAVMLGVIGGGLWGWANGDPADRQPPPVYYEAPAFALTDQNGHPFDLNALRGKVWVCDFIFTHCAGPCRTMAEEIVKLQQQIKAPDARFVSFSVDPERDTPERLKEYARDWGGDPRWVLLTGSPEAMREVARGMHVTALRDPKAEQGILHDTHFLLIDARGQMRGSYAVDEPQKLKQLVRDVARLGREAAGGNEGGDPAGNGGHAP